MSSTRIDKMRVFNAASSCIEDIKKKRIEYNKTQIEGMITDWTLQRVNTNIFLNKITLGLIRIKDRSIYHAMAVDLAKRTYTAEREIWFGFHMYEESYEKAYQLLKLSRNSSVDYVDVSGDDIDVIEWCK